MSDTESDYQNMEPWVVVDQFWKKEWLLPQPVRYFIVQSKATGEWSVCDRWTDLIVHGTESKSRADSIRLFYKWCKREIPDGIAIDRAMPGVAHHGETG